MGYGTRTHRHGQIQTYWPDDTDTEFYIADGASLSEIFSKALEKWPELTPIQLQDVLAINAEYIHTDCLTYDLYDSGDWTRFLRVSKVVE